FGHQDTREEVTGGAYRFKLGTEIAFRDTAIKAGDRATRGISEGGDNFTEESRANADVAVSQHQDFVGGFASQMNQLVDFLIGTQLGRANEDADFVLGKLGDEALDQAKSFVMLIVQSKEDFVIGVILTAETREILVRGEIGSPDRFEDADGRSK